ncbi:MAG: hypothetical protein M5R40_29510 [Anaerolineae bacterium]|nr:hypothetical protein [Anaerolineae bacterium]
MNTQTQSTHPEQARLGGFTWALALIPLLILGAALALIVATGGGLTELSGPPVEQVTFQRVMLPEPGVVQVVVINDGPQEVTIPQVLVDDAYWSFTAQPSMTIPRLGRATFTIPYPWVEGEAHEVMLITSLGTTFPAEIPVAVETPQLSMSLFLQFGLIGLYVGIVPVTLGVLWYPFMRRLSGQAMNFILALTVGLLIFLAVGTFLDALEFAGALPAFWQGVPMVAFIALIALGRSSRWVTCAGSAKPLRWACPTGSHWGSASITWARGWRLAQRLRRAKRRSARS